MQARQYEDYVLGKDAEIIRLVQDYCADIAARDMPEEPLYPRQWNERDGFHIACLLNRSSNPMALFRFMDEKTGSMEVGYRTRDGREWLHILRQMRNTGGSGLLENLQ